MSNMRRDEIARLIRSLRHTCRENGLGSVRFEVRTHQDNPSEMFVQCKTVFPREVLERLIREVGYRPKSFIDDAAPSYSRSTKELKAEPK